MKKEFDPAHVDLRALAQDAGVLSGKDKLASHARLVAETDGSGAQGDVAWSAAGELREVAGGAAQVWLHLTAHTVLPMICQRCLTPVDIALDVERDFRFVADEATASAEDDEAEEDVLVLVRDFDLKELVEDELLMELPVVPRHEVCPVDVKLAVADKEFTAEQEVKANPFAALQGLKTDKGS